MKYKILIVDDESANLRALERLFRHDYTVLTAESAEEALTLLTHHDFALMISDQRMPKMSGIELVQRTVKLRPHMVRILLTGYSDISVLIEAINCGHVYKFVTKPWNNDDLVLTVTRAIEHYQNIRARHSLEMMNNRLRARLDEISQLAALDDEVLGDPPNLNQVVVNEQEPEFASSH